MGSPSNIPTVFTAFGATGDLMRLKVVPALFKLFEKGELPTMFRVVGFSRRDYTDEQFRTHVREALEGHIEDADRIDSFLELFQFQKGQFDEKESYAALKQSLAAQDEVWRVCSNKLFYLASSPEFFDTILHNLSESGLTDPCDDGEGWSRVIVEKPFGLDYESSQKLDTLLGELFDERQIYRIDHYLAKEMLQNILTFRFANNLFELNWDKDFIERVDMRLLESVGCEKRGQSYDGVGALRDVGQNHLLQMIALITMEHPESFEPSKLRPQRAAVLHKLKVPSEESIKHTSFRAQYEGYRSISGVKPDSDTETYFRVRADIDTDRWHDVPIYIESGKRLGDPLKEIVVTMRHPVPCLCPSGVHHKNRIIFRMEPKEEILVEFWSRKPGLSMETEERTFHFLLREKKVHAKYTEEYMRLLLDSIRGDQTLFISTDEIKAMWRFTDPIIAGWKKGLVPLETYAVDEKAITERACERVV